MTTNIFFEAQFTDNPNAAQIVRIYTDSTLAQVQAAGWLSNPVSQGYVLSPKNKYLISYNSGSNVDFFNLAISAGVYTLSIANTDVILPTIANHIAVFSNTSGTLTEDPSTAISGGNIQAGVGTTAGTLISRPAAATSGTLIVKAVTNSSGNFNTTISNAAAVAQSQVISIPDSGGAAANFLLDAGTGAVISVNNLKYGATPVAQVDPASCTITAAAGAANHCTITIQLKDGSGTNMTRVIPFKVYLATDATGLTLQSAASTGYSVTSGGVKDPTGSTTITQGLAAFASATGGCVVDLLDTGKGTGNLILMFANGFKASAAITSGSYG